MQSHPYEWGWRIRCPHPGCENSHMTFGAQASGPPPIHFPTGWYRQQVRAGAFDRPVQWLFLCPDHAHIGQAYDERLEAWRAARRAEALRYREVLKAELQTVRGHLRSLWDDAMRRKGQWRLDQHMAKWVEENPKPTSLLVKEPEGL